MPGRLVNSQGRKYYWLPFHCAISPLLLLPFRTAVVELRLPLSGWVCEFRRSCGREGERENPSLVVVLVVLVAVGVVREQKRIWL
jgi:hypothetical protein